MIQHRSKWFNIFIENPFKTWWQARKYFKIPQTIIHLFFNNRVSIPSPYLWSNHLGRIIDIHIADISWKDKWGSPRHEENPMIFICFFRLFGIKIIPTIKYKDEFGETKNGDLEYWEYLLDYLYYRKTLRAYSAWISDSKLYRVRYYGKDKDTFEPSKCIVPCVAMSLNKKGIKKLKKELNEKGRDIEDD